MTEAAVTDMRSIKSHPAKHSAELHVYFIRNGWVMPKKTSAAKSHGTYKSSSARAVQALKQELSLPVVSLEEELIGAKGRSRQKCVDYCPMDGRWNRVGIGFIAEIVVRSRELSASGKIPGR